MDLLKRSVLIIGSVEAVTARLNQLIADAPKGTYVSVLENVLTNNPIAVPALNELNESMLSASEVNEEVLHQETPLTIIKGLQDFTDLRIEKGPVVWATIVADSFEEAKTIMQRQNIKIPFRDIEICTIEPRFLN